MSDYDTSGAAWITSRACNNSACVQVAHLPGGIVAIRDSKDTTKAAHFFDGEEWAAFVTGVKAGEFDLPVS
ncbi:MAG TPA: DUF397 domain-containing protein [Streptosporangiaceae bacterium]|jgi:hypothetical protein|nr:DUF397 domain-containing protein [Streptosporangiaceae bacterium]